jgi:hypothetical protein
LKPVHEDVVGRRNERGRRLDGDFGARPVRVDGVDPEGVVHVLRTLLAQVNAMGRPNLTLLLEL